MARRYFNWKLAIVLLMGVVVLGATAVSLRRWQRSHRAENALPEGLSAYEQQRWEEAAQNLGRYLTANPDDVDVLLKYADAQLNIRPSKPNHIQQAINAYRAALRADKSNCEAAERLIEIYLGIGSPGEAELIARRQLKTDKPAPSRAEGNPHLRRMLALALMDQRKFAEAATELKSILADHPDQVLAYETLGRLAEQRPDILPDLPAHWFDEAVKNNPSSALAYVIRAGFHLRGTDTVKAIADLEQAEKLNLSDPDARIRLAIEFTNADILDKAETHFAAVRSAKPTSPVLWQSWAQLALKSRSQQKMLEVAEAGLKELSQRHWDFLPTAAELFIRAGKLDRASECTSELRQKDVLPQIVAYIEGLIADQKGQTWEAVKLWQRSIQTGNKSPQVRLALASALSQIGDTQAALRELRSLVSQWPEDFSGRIALARLLTKNGNWAEAAEQARRATELQPTNLEAALYQLRAQIYQLATQSKPPDARLWQDIEGRLAALEKATDGAWDVKLLQFQAALQQNDLVRAGAVLAELKKDQSSTLTGLAEADLLVAQGKTDDAIRILRQTINEFPDAVEPVNYLAILLHRQDKRDQCQAIIKDALARIERLSAQRDLGLLLAQLYTQWKQTDKAYELLEPLAEALPDDIALKRQLLANEQVIKDRQKAQQLIDQIKALEGDNGWQWRYEQAKLWFGDDDFKTRYPQIASLLQANLLANPNDQASRVLLAAAYDRAGELRLAISTYQEAMSRSPDDIRIIIPLVALLYRANQENQANEILRRASERNLYHPQLQALQLQSHLRRGELVPASDILDELLKNDPNNRAVCLSLAGLRMQQNQFAEAEQLLDRLKAQDANSLEATSALVRLKIRQGQSEQALRLCDELVNNLKNAPAYMLRAAVFARMGQADKAIADLEQAGGIEPNSAEVWTAKSDLYVSSGQQDKALDCLQQAMSLAPNDIEIQTRAITLLLASGNPDKARQGQTMLDNALKSNPEDIELRLFKVRILLAERNAPARENAKQILGQITEQQPQISQAWVLLGQMSLEEQQPAKALEAAMRGLAHKPSDKALLLLKANAEFVRAPILAIPTLRTLHELNPSDTDIAVRLATTYVAAGQPQNAVKLLQKNIASPASAQEQRRVDIALAIALHKNGNKQEAQKKLDLLVQADPNDPGPLLAQVQLLVEDGVWDELSQMVAQWQQKHPRDSRTALSIATYLVSTGSSQAIEIAEAVLRQTVQNNPNSEQAMVNLAILFYMTARPAESAQLYQRVLEINPNNLVAINNFAWMLCEEQGKLQQALDLTERGLKIAPQYVDLIDTRGVIHYRRGEFDKAIEYFSKCLKLYPDTVPTKATCYFHLARALVKNGQDAKATEHLNQALDLHKKIKGLSPADQTEAQRLLEQLQKGS